jgi:hypothetical protein
MDDIIVSLLVILGTAILVGVIFILVYYRKRKSEQVLIELARQKGWRYEKVNERLSAGYRFHGAGWLLEGLRVSSDSTSSASTTHVRDYTRWFSSQATFSPGILMIGPKQPEVNLGGISDVLKQTMLKLMVGEEANDALGIEESLIGRMALRERYMVWTNQEEKARELLTPEMENALIRYPGKLPPVVKWNSKGVEVKLISQRLEKAADIEGLAAIGEAFLL